MHTTHFELASLAVQVAHWRGKKDPQFVEAMEILGSAREHLANPWKARTGEDYERILQILQIMEMTRLMLLNDKSMHAFSRSLFRRLRGRLWRARVIALRRVFPQALVVIPT